MHGPTPEPGYDLERDLERREAQHWDRPHQLILNAHSIPAKRAQRTGWVPVRARLVWERDGEEWVDTFAFAWTARLVLVELSDPRHEIRGVWLVPQDVERRARVPGEIR